MRAEQDLSGSTTFALPFAGRAIHFYRPRDPVALMNAVTEAEFSRDEQLPYWSEHWPAADALFAYLAQCSLPPCDRLCEVGCGLGVISTLLALRGLPLTAAFDISPAACRWARANLRRNRQIAAVVCADFRRPPFRTQFDLIVGSDVLYEARWVEAVVAFLTASLAKGGTALIADPCRTHWPRFLQDADRAGLSASIVHRAVLNEGKTMVEVARLTH